MNSCNNTPKPRGESPLNMLPASPRFEQKIPNLNMTQEEELKFLREQNA